MSQTMVRMILNEINFMNWVRKVQSFKGKNMKTFNVKPNKYQIHHLNDEYVLKI